MLGYIAKKLDPDGVDLIFTTSGSPVLGCKHSRQLLQHLKAAKFNGLSNMAASLGRLLQEYQTRLDRDSSMHSGFMNRSKASDRYRRRNFYVLTDGLWQPESDVRSVIQAMILSLKRHGIAQKHQMGIQFIRFGNDSEGKRRLKELDDNIGSDLCVFPNQVLQYSNDDAYRSMLIQRYRRYHSFNGQCFENASRRYNSLVRQ